MEKRWNEAGAVLVKVVRIWIFLAWFLTNQARLFSADDGLEERRH
jgi:hypothetical protein